jgi:hypothetical protein
MSRAADNKFTINVAYDREDDEFYCIRLPDRPLPREFRNVSARSLKALRRKLAPIIRKEFFEPEPAIELLVVKR